MVNKDNTDEVQIDSEVTHTDTETTDFETELEDVEENLNDKIKKLRDKLKEVEEEKRTALEDLQRAKADFLNAKRRLEEDKIRDRERAVNKHLEKLLPLCDGFELGMQNKELWEKADPTWKQGITGIYSQLKNILDSYGVSTENPKGEDFDPTRHEALSLSPTTDESQNHKILEVVQLGYVRKIGETTEIIRPARVLVAEYTQNC